MVRTLLICGLIAGLVAGVLAFGFDSLAGEPAVDDAIAFEEANAPKPAPGEKPEAEVVSRDTQKGFGLLTATVAYGLAIGGIFAIVFSVLYGRLGRGRLSPLRTSWLLAGAAFLVLYVVPFLKYPPNPPAVGDPDTIGERTALYFVMMWISVSAAVAAWRLRRVFAERMSSDAANVSGVLVYAGICTVAALSLPSKKEIPADFPATTLWQFREASFGTQFILWLSIGVVFAFLAQRVMEGKPIVSWSRGDSRAPAPAGD